MNSIVIAGVDDEGFKMAEEPSSEAIELIQHHGDRLRALLDKPVILNVFWEDGDTEATVAIIPCLPENAPEEEYTKPFKTFRIAFPDKEVCH